MLCKVCAVCMPAAHAASQVMRGGARAVGAVGGEDEVEAALDRALVLFRYIQVRCAALWIMGRAPQHAGFQ